jgi:hypothetical protein
MAIYARSVGVTHKEFPWLSPALVDAVEIAVQQLRTDLEGQDPSAIRLAAEALVVNFSDLLVVLIGDHLTLCLFEEAWPGGCSADSRQERTE